MSEAYQETREIPSHHILQGNDLIELKNYNFIFFDSFSERFE